MPSGVLRSGQWMIIADDITGAADSAVAFACQRLSAMVTWAGDVEATATRSDVHAYDADSRGLSADAAAERHAQILTRLLRPDQMLFKKIVSSAALKFVPRTTDSGTLSAMTFAEASIVRRSAFA